MSKQRIEPKLECKVERGKLIISLPLSILKFAFEASEYNNSYVEETGMFRKDYKVIDVKEFGNDVANEMLYEEEDGSTPLTDFLDKMCRNAVGNGSIALEKDGRMHYGCLEEETINVQT